MASRVQWICQFAHALAAGCEARMPTNGLITSATAGTAANAVVQPPKVAKHVTGLHLTAMFQAKLEVVPRLARH